MRFTAHASSSRGNLYTLECGEDRLLIEAGLTARQIAETTGFQLSRYAGAVVSHSHQDHARGVTGLLDTAVDVWMSREAAEDLGISHRRLHVLTPAFTEAIGHFAVHPFLAEHDSPGTLGFVIDGPDGDRLLYLTDTMFSRYTFAGVTVMAIEANHDVPLMDRLVAEGAVSHERRNRVRQSHMSLQTALDLLRANDLSRVREIHLLHLSEVNSDAKEFRQRVQEATGIPTYVAPTRTGEAVV